MDASQFKFTGVSNSVMETYTSLLVPRLFVPWARHLLDQAEVQPGQHVLDVATGPGTVAHLAAERVGKNGRVVAADISPEMLALAKANSPGDGHAPVEYVESPAAPLKVDDAQFDSLLCQQGLQFFPDKVEAVKEMKRATRPGGKIVLAVWANIEDCPLFHAIYRGLKQSVPEDLAEMMRGPFSFPDGEALKNLCHDAGLETVELKRQSLPLLFEGGIEQGVTAIHATPIGPQVNALDAKTQEAAKESIEKELTALAKGSAIETHATSHWVVATVG